MRLATWNTEWFDSLFKNTVQHERNVGDMIKMGVGQKDMADRSHLSKAQITDAAAGINENILIHQY